MVLPGRLRRLVHLAAVSMPFCAVAVAMVMGGHAEAAHAATQVHPLLWKWW